MTIIEQTKSKFFEALLKADISEWSLDSLEEVRLTATDIEVPVSALFKGEADIALQEFNTFCDGMILADLKAKGVEELRTHEKVEQALALKFRYMHDAPTLTMAGIRYLTNPLRYRLALRLQWQTLDAIWYFAGDQATDFNYYSKRSLLGYIFKTTLVYWMRHRHQDIQQTLDYMHRRFMGVAKIHKAKAQLQQSLAMAKSFFNRAS